MNAPTGDSRIVISWEAIEAAAVDAVAKAARCELAAFRAALFLDVGTELHVLGHFIGSERVSGDSPFGQGNDETVAVSVLLRIASQLISASANLFGDGRHYAAAALLRQIVEIEYLAWAFEAQNGVGESWLRSDKRTRKNFFTPAKLRDAAKGKFRGKDYGYHCELGGHPVPEAGRLLSGDTAIAELLLADLLGHAGRIWDHLDGLARQNENGQPILKRGQSVSDRFRRWKATDLLVDLPPPP